MGNYATASDVTSYKIDGSTVDLSAYTTAEIDTVITRTEEYIEYVTNDVFYSKTATFKFDGNGQNKLFFVPVTPLKLLTITSVKDLDFDGSTVIQTFVENTDYKKYDFFIETHRRYPNNDVRRGIGRGGNWPRGQKNIEVVGTWGHSATPEDIKWCTTVLTIERLKPGTSKLTSRDVKQVNWSDYTVTFAGTSDEGNLTGFIDVDRILSKYVNVSSMFIPVPSEPFDRNIRL
jgi:hypothetical protein